MNSRERILAAINHKESDRVPVDLGATPSSGISLVAHNNLIEYLGKRHLKSYVYDVIQEVVQPETELLEYFNVDVIDVGRYFNQSPDYWHELELIQGYPGLYPHLFKPRQDDDGSWYAYNKNGDAVGRMPSGATFFDQTIFPYEDNYPDNFDKLDVAIENSLWGSFGFTPWDWIERPDFWSFLRKKIEELKSKTDKALLIGVGCNLFESGTILRRMDNFLMDLYLQPLEVHRFLDALMLKHMEFISNVCTAVGDLVDVIKFGDDLGMNNGPFIPVETYDEFFLPRHQQLCDYVKNNSTATTMLHSCGGIYELIPRLIEAGFDILNPVQINAINMEPWRLKKEFGQDITFWGGGIDTKSILNHGTPKQVENHVRQNLEVFYKDGGFVFNTVHNIMPDVPPENIIAMFEAVNEF